MSTEERRSRLVVRQGLFEPASDVVEASRSVVALHSSDPATVFLSVWARVSDFETEDLEQALYEQKSLLRLLGMRRTMWVVPTELAAAVNSSSTAALAAPQRRRTIEMIETGGVTDDGERWLEDVSHKVLESLEQRGEATARELKEDVPELAAKFVAYKKDGSVMGEFGVSTRVLFLLATEAEVVRARPLGSWVSSQYRWTTMGNWLGRPLAKPPKSESQDDVVRRWLSRFGPGTEKDLKWWTGWPVTQVRKSLERVGAEEVHLDEGIGYVLDDDLDPVAAPGPSIALLPSLDATTMGWKERDWYLDDAHVDRLYDRSGNAGPTIWVNGRVVGGWAQTDSGSIAYEIFSDVGSEADAAVAQRAADLEQWLGETNVTARFRSRHDKALSGD